MGHRDRSRSRSRDREERIYFELQRLRRDLPVGITIDPDGFVPIRQLSNTVLQEYSFRDIQTTVENYVWSKGELAQRYNWAYKGQELCVKIYDLPLGSTTTSPSWNESLLLSRWPLVCAWGREFH